MKASYIINFTNRLIDYLKMIRNFRHPRVSYNGTNNKSIIVLGNGPSAKILTKKLDITENVDMLCVNDFASSELYKQYKPNVYLIWDPAYWTPIEKTNPVDYENRIKTISSIANDTTWHLDFYCPVEALKTGEFNLLKNNKNINVVPLNRCELSLTDAPYYYRALSKNLASPSVNVIASAIWLSINIGYSQLFLLAVENSWTKDLVVNDNNEVCTVREHFYGEKTFEVWRKSDTSLYAMNEILSDLSKLFLNYRLLQKYADIKSVNIYNCTPNSFIDAFTRASIEEIR